MNPYSKTNWQDHVVEKPDTYTQTTNPDGTIKLTPAPGTIIQQGTPMSATNFNNMENGIYDAHELNAVLTQEVRQHKRLLADLQGEVGQVTLTNTQTYPFNNSATTVALQKSRDTLDYTVQTEIVSSVGIPGSIKVSAKQLNGFKIEFDGSATSVTIKYIVRGGMYQ